MKAWALLACCWVSYSLLGQTKPAFENLSIDRPDISNLPNTVLPGHFQFENGFEINTNEKGRNTYLPFVLFRTGLNQRAEIRLGSTWYTIDSVSKSSLDRMRTYSVAVKYRLLEERGLIPAIAVQPEINIDKPAGSDGQTQVLYEWLLLFNNTFHRQIFINYNYGWFWSEHTATRHLASASLSFLHTHRLGYFVEAYAIQSRRERGPISLDLGLTFLLTPRLQFDFYSGKKWGTAKQHFFWGGGFGFRIDANDLQPRSFKEIGIHH